MSRPISGRSLTEMVRSPRPISGFADVVRNSTGAGGINRRDSMRDRLYPLDHKERQDSAYDQGQDIRLTSRGGDGDHDSHGDENEDAAKPSKIRRTILMAILLLGLMFSILDTSIVSTALVKMGVELHDFERAPWVVLAYLLTYMGFAIPLSKLSDVFGRDVMLFFAWAFFGVFSIGCALSKTMIHVIIFRALQGIGGSGLYSLCQIGMVELFPSNPSLIGALVGSTLAVSFVLGPILGGVISNNAGWPYVFWINVPFAVAAVILVPICWPKQTRKNLLSGFLRMDWLGALLCLAGSVLLIVGLQEGAGYGRSWSDFLVLGCLIGAGVAWFGFWTWETLIGFKILKNISIAPVFPMRFHAELTMSAAASQTLMTGLPYISLTIILPETYQLIDGDNPLTAGLRLLPLLTACAIGSFVAGALSTKKNLTSLTLIFASALQLLGLALFSTVHPEYDLRSMLDSRAPAPFFGHPGDSGNGTGNANLTHPVNNTHSGGANGTMGAGARSNISTTANAALRTPVRLLMNRALGGAPPPLGTITQPIDIHHTTKAAYFYQFVFGLGVGLSLAAASMITSIQAAHHDHASAHGAVAQARVLGGALGVVAFTIVLNHHYETYVVPFLPSQLAGPFMRSPVQVLAGLGPAAQEWVRVVYLTALGAMMKGLIFVGGACLLVSLLAWDPNPTDTVAAMQRHKMAGGGDDVLAGHVSGLSDSGTVAMQEPAPVARRSHSENRWQGDRRSGSGDRRSISETRESIRAAFRHSWQTRHAQYLNIPDDAPAPSIAPSDNGMGTMVGAGGMVTAVANRRSVIAPSPIGLDQLRQMVTSGNLAANPAPYASSSARATAASEDGEDDVLTRDPLRPVPRYSAGTSNTGFRTSLRRP